MPKTRKKSLAQRQKADREAKQKKRDDISFRTVENLRRSERLKNSIDDEEQKTVRNQRRKLQRQKEREDEERRKIENQRRQLERKKEREDEEKRKIENRRRLLERKKEREDEEKRKIENRRRLLERKKERKDEEKRKIENHRRQLERKKEREDDAKRKRDNFRRKQEHQRERQDDEEREAENLQRKMERQEGRKISQKREVENLRRRLERQKEREDEEKRKTDNMRRNRDHKQERQDAEKRKAGNARRRLSRIEERKNEQNRRVDNIRRKYLRRIQMKDEYFRRLDNVRRKLGRRAEREDNEARMRDNLRRNRAYRRMRSVHQSINNLRRINMNPRAKRTPRDSNWLASQRKRMQQLRSDDAYRTPEKQKDATRRAQQRLDPVRRRLEFQAKATQSKNKRALARSTLDKLKETFLRKIRQGPIWICSCCGSLCYEESTIKVDEEKLRKRGCSEETIVKVLHVSQTQHRLCSTCFGHIKKNKIPRVALTNGLDYQEIPPALQGLNRLEERLVALRLPFMQIRLRSHPTLGQWHLKGNVVNVENNLNTCVTSIPRPTNQSDVVQLKLKRKMSYTGHYIYDKINPSKVLSAAEYLLSTPLYKEEGVVLTPGWNDFNVDESGNADFIVDDGDDHDNEHDAAASTSEQVPTRPQTDKPDDDVVGAEESLLHYADFTNANQSNDLSSTGISIAPGEGNIPIPVNRDLDAEYLSFPTIYCGKRMEFAKGVKLSYTDIAKSKAKRYDRRGVKPEKILWMHKKSYNQKAFDRYNIALRKRKGGHNNAPLTAGTLKDASAVQNILYTDDGYAVFKTLRSSPAYLKNQMKKVVAMVRQLGTCSFFITLSAAETKWDELIVHLMKVLEGKDMENEQVQNVNVEKRMQLIRDDPVTCMRHFDRKYKALLTELFKQKNGVFHPYEVEDHYSRIEFQMRGSPHSHGLYWLKNAPRYEDGNPESEKKCVA